MGHYRTTSSFFYMDVLYLLILSLLAVIRTGSSSNKVSNISPLGHDLLVLAHWCKQCDSHVHRKYFWWACKYNLIYKLLVICDLHCISLSIYIYIVMRSYLNKFLKVNCFIFATVNKSYWAKWVSYAQKLGYSFCMLIGSG